MFRLFSALVAIVALFQLMCIAIPLDKRAGVNIEVTSASNFCSYLPPKEGDNVGTTENDGVPYCTSVQSAGTKQFPEGFIVSSHYQATSTYKQVTGRIDRTKYKLSASDGGGQYDNRNIVGSTCNGWKYFVNLVEPDVNIFCIRCCTTQADCNLGLSTYGCQRIVPGIYT
ncbi:hypothetical protein BX666DRAFT_1995217 [Dichotomocladium elegans]|nr:hypothetical protein BX666DRAFT_1995217 [Dichotomocladium elegans]